MNDISKKLAIAFSLFIIFGFLILTANEQLEKQVESIQDNRNISSNTKPPEPSEYAAPKPVRIDPMNDPLAPVQNRVHERTAQEMQNKRKALMSSRPHYEVPLDDLLIVQ